MPLYLEECMPSLSFYGTVVSFLVVFAPLFIRGICCAGATTTNDDLAPTFFFGTYRLWIIQLGVLFNVGRMLYELERSNLFAILVATRVLCGIVQYFDHSKILREWVPYITSPVKRQRRYLWLRMFVGFTAMLTIGFVQMAFHEYVVYVEIDHQPDTYTTSFVQTFCGNLVGALSMALWLTWFRAGARLVKYRYHILRNFLWTWCPFYFASGLLRVPAMVNAGICGVGVLLGACGVVVHLYMVLPEERVGWASTEYELDPQRSNARRIACDSGFEDPSSSSPAPAPQRAGAMPRRGTLEDHSSESSVELAAIDVDVSDDTVESPKLPVSSDSDDGDGDGAGGARPIVARPRFQYYPFTRPRDIESGRGDVSTDDVERAPGSASKAKPAGTDSAASEEAPRVTAYEKHLVWARSTDKAACVFFQVLFFYSTVMAVQTILDMYLWYHAYPWFGDDVDTSLYWCASNWSLTLNAAQTMFDMVTG